MSEKVPTEQGEFAKAIFDEEAQPDFYRSYDEAESAMRRKIRADAVDPRFRGEYPEYDVVQVGEGDCYVVSRTTFC